MLIEARNTPRSQTDLEKVVGDFSKPGVVDEINALADMDPVSSGILTKRIPLQVLHERDETAIRFGDVD